LTVAFTGGIRTTTVLFTTGEGLVLLFGTTIVVLAFGGVVVFVLGGITGVITGVLGTEP
jgi:hypothetical protein